MRGERRVTLPKGVSRSWWARVKKQIAQEGYQLPLAWTAMGENVDDRFGYSVASVGDVNGDGYADVVVTALYFNYYAGKAYLYLGSASGLSSSPAWTATGEYPDDEFGSSVASAGDVNGDGYNDVVIGALGYQGIHNQLYLGKAYLYLGSSSGLSPSPAWTAIGDDFSDHFGCSVATAGDVNGDGFADVIVGGWGYNDKQGKAYLYTGSASGLSPSPSWTATGEDTSAGFGSSVATAGDVNGDGYSDVIVGDGGYDNVRGKTYLYLGSASGLSSRPSWTASGENQWDQFGYCVSTAGDVNGDGYADVIVGAILYNANQGKAYLYLGSPSGLSPDPSWTAMGENATDEFGWCVAAAGDVNGDGYGDVLVGAPLAPVSGGYFGAGKVYLYFGSAAGLSYSPAWTATGENADDDFGQSVAATGDVNGDGYADVIVGAYNFGSAKGKAYVYYGGTVPPLYVSTSAEPTSIDPGGTVHFSASPTGGAGSYIFEWTFGDGSQSTGQVVDHVYGESGSYQASVTVTDSVGDTTTSGDISILVFDLLTVSLTASPTGGAAPLSVDFTPSASGGDCNYTYTYAYGDGSTGTDAHHTYSTPGTYAATVTVADGAGHSAVSSALEVVVVPPPPVIASAHKQPTPFRIVLLGSNFQPNCTATINGTPVDVKYKNGGKIKLKHCKALCPKGVAVVIVITNPDGGVSAPLQFTK
jgi:PKD repeat protein